MPVTAVSPQYLKLIRRFPLRPIRSDEELERAIVVRPLTPAARLTATSATITTSW